MKRWAVLLGLALIVVVVLADTGRLGILHAVYDFPHGDKLAHFGLFGLLSLLVNLAVFEARPAIRRGRLAFQVSLALALVIGLEEWSQRFFATRTSSLLDLAASYAGVALFAWLAARIAWDKQKPPGAAEEPTPGA